MSEMKNIQKLNISYNSFVELPGPIARLQELTNLIANNNFIIGEYIYAYVHYKERHDCIKKNTHAHVILLGLSN